MTLLVSHIPKTAGTSLKKLVERFHPDATFVYRRELALGNPDLDFIRRFRELPRPALIMGHFSYSVHRLLGVAPAYVTVLRDPIARVVSLYRYQRSLPDSPFAAHFQAGISIATFVSAQLTEMTNNHMCRVIAGIPPEAGLSINEQWLLDLALHNLRRHYVLVGTSEKFDEFVTALAGKLNWKEFIIPRENETTGDSVVPDEDARAAIVEQNRLDIELFEYAKEISN